MPTGTSNLNPETRDKTVRYLVAQMDRLLGYRRPKSYKVSTKNCGVTLPYHQLYPERPLSQGANGYVWLRCVMVLTDRYVFLKAINRTKQHGSDNENLGNKTKRIKIQLFNCIKDSKGSLKLLHIMVNINEALKHTGVDNIMI